MWQTLTPVCVSFFFCRSLSFPLLTNLSYEKIICGLNLVQNLTSACFCNFNLMSYRTILLYIELQNFEKNKKRKRKRKKDERDGKKLHHTLLVILPIHNFKFFSILETDSSLLFLLPFCDLFIFSSIILHLLFQIFFIIFLTIYSFV